MGKIAYIAVSIFVLIAAIAVNLRAFVQNTEVAAQQYCYQATGGTLGSSGAMNDCLLRQPDVTTTSIVLAVVLDAVLVYLLVRALKPGLWLARRCIVIAVNYMRVHLRPVE